MYDIMTYCYLTRPTHAECLDIFDAFFDDTFTRGHKHARDHSHD